MAKVELSMEEFLQLQQMATSGGGGDCSSCPHLEKSSSPGLKKKRRTRKKSASDKKMSQALTEATAKGKLKSGAWKKGWNQSRVMKEAHRLKKKM